MLLAASFSSASHWHDDAQPDLDCIACFYEYSSEATLETKPAPTLELITGLQILTTDYAAKLAAYGPYSARAPPVFR